MQTTITLKFVAGNSFDIVCSKIGILFFANIVFKLFQCNAKKLYLQNKK